MIVKEDSELCSQTGELKCSSESYDKGGKLGAGAQKAGASHQLKAIALFVCAHRRRAA